LRVPFNRRSDEFLDSTSLHEPVRGGHATERWAGLIIAIVRSPADPATLRDWGRISGASRGSIRAWCHAARVPPKASLDFGRLLRAIVRAAGQPWDLQELLDVVDERTVKSLLARAGLSGVQPQGHPPTLAEFLERQRLIQRSVSVQAVRELLL
jgi:hypothetical protein